MSKLETRLTEIKKRCEAATEPYDAIDLRNEVIESGTGLSIGRQEPLYLFANEADPKFIAHARTDVPMLLQMLFKTIRLVEKHGCFCEDEYTCFGCEWQPELEKIAEKYK